MVIQNILNEKIISRDFYLNKINSYFNTPLIKVLIWQRRVWKSTILKNVIQNLVNRKEIYVENIFYINKELPFFDEIKEYDDLKNSFWEFIKKTKSWKIFVWIDEIQEIQNWEKFVNWLLAEYQENIEIFITWSNSFLLSGELSTYLTWRYIEFEIYPLSYSEFSVFKKEEKSKKLFLEYLKFGWLPAIFKMEYSEETIFPYLLWVYNTIIVKDIIQHHKIKNISFFKDLYKYTLSNIWNIISWKSIKDYLKSQNIAIWNDTVLNFLHYALETFILHKVYSVNPETKKYFEIYNKYYSWDLWIRNSLVWYNFKRDIWNLLENYVFLEIKRNWYDVQIGRLKSNKEIDFIISKNWITKYLQVCYLLGSEQTIEREFSSLEEIKDNWEKYVISFDDIDHWNYKWIKHINIMDLEKNL
jgi:predicted AAA+ superfamily ATPase